MLFITFVTDVIVAVTENSMHVIAEHPVTEEERLTERKVP